MKQKYRTVLRQLRAGEIARPDDFEYCAIDVPDEQIIDCNCKVESFERIKVHKDRRVPSGNFVFRMKKGSI